MTFLDLVRFCRVVRDTSALRPDVLSHYLKGLDQDFSRAVVVQNYVTMNKDKVEMPPETNDLSLLVRSFLSLVRLLMVRKSSLPHDRIYGILGVAHDVDPIEFAVSYTEPFWATFARAARYIIGLHSDLVVLKLTTITPSDLKTTFGPRELPSWIPDFRVAVDQESNMRVALGPMFLGHGDQRLHNASGLSRVRLCQENFLDLILQGVLVGQIVFLSEPDGNITHTSCIGRNVLSGGSWSLLAQLCAQDGMYVPTNEAMTLAYACLRINGMLPEEQTRKARMSRATPLLEIPEPRPGKRSWDGKQWQLSDMDEMTTSVLKATSGQRLYLTDTGYMGLAHQSCQKGDSVYVMMGADMPLVLHKLETGLFQYKGESYVHGIMEGEFLLKHFKKAEDSEFMTDQQWLDRLAEEPLPFPTEWVTLV